MKSAHQTICPKRQIRAAVASAFGVEEHYLIGRSRKRKYVLPRHMTVYVLRRRFPEMSYPRIGRLLGGRDHTTMIHADRKMAWHVARDERFAALARHLIGEGQRDYHDAHVKAWTVHCDMEAARDAAFAASNDGDEGSPERMWCAQCDRLVMIAEARRCKAAFCSLERRAA